MVWKDTPTQNRNARSEQQSSCSATCPPTAKPSQGILRHKGWRVEKVDLPKIAPGQNVTVLAPAEIEIE